MDECAIDSGVSPDEATRSGAALGDFRTHVTLSITVYRIPELLYSVAALLLLEIHAMFPPAERELCSLSRRHRRRKIRSHHVRMFYV